MHGHSDLCLRVQAAGEKIMRNVAQRLMNRELATAVITWQSNLNEVKAKERAHAICKRVGLRMLNRDLSDAVMEWRDQQVEEKNRLRGEGIMRRVGSRMRNKELAMNWAEWVRNYKAGILEMWQNRAQNTKIELEALQMKFAFTTQVQQELR